MLTNDQFAAMLSLGREQNGVEFKGAGPRTDKNLLVKVIRASLGMSNRRDGGWVVVGVNEGESGIDPAGLSDNDLLTWSYDAFGDNVAVYADPGISFDLQTIVFNDKKFLAIRVTEFEEAPTICKKDYNAEGKIILREGALYVRGRRKPETTEVRSLNDMRDLLELATEKALRRFISRASAVGLSTIEADDVADENSFNEQLGDLR